MVELKNYILHYCPLNDEDLMTVLSRFTVKTLSKKQHLLKQGQVCREFAYVAKGLFRQYYKDRQDKEITSWISFENTPATELASFLSQQPAKFYIQALEDSEVATITYADLEIGGEDPRGRHQPNRLVPKRDRRAAIQHALAATRIFPARPPEISCLADRHHRYFPQPAKKKKNVLAMVARFLVIWQDFGFAFRRIFDKKKNEQQHPNRPDHWRQQRDWIRDSPSTRPAGYLCDRHRP
jgi:cyclic nucleotide-binding protein